MVVESIISKLMFKFDLTSIKMSTHINMPEDLRCLSLTLHSRPKISVINTRKASFMSCVISLNENISCGAGSLLEGHKLKLICEAAINVGKRMRHGSKEFIF